MDLSAVGFAQAEVEVVLELEGAVGVVVDGLADPAIDLVGGGVGEELGVGNQIDGYGAEAFSD